MCRNARCDHDGKNAQKLRRMVFIAQILIKRRYFLIPVVRINDFTQTIIFLLAQPLDVLRRNIVELFVQLLKIVGDQIQRILICYRTDTLQLFLDLMQLPCLEFYGKGKIPGRGEYFIDGRFPFRQIENFLGLF